MGFYILLLLIFGFVVFLMILTQPAQKSAVILINSGPVLLITVGCLLTLLRRGAVGLPLIFIGLSWWRRNYARRQMAPPKGHKSTVRSAGLEMVLDHVTGDIDGTVLTGSMKGKRLSDLNEKELMALYQELAGDSDSCALLESYLDRCHPDWRDSGDYQSRGNGQTGAGNGEMSVEEARLILGVEPGASKKEIDEAWRRLIKKVHPDHGGSAFLTAKINAAREVLLKR